MQLASNNCPDPTPVRAVEKFRLREKGSPGTRHYTFAGVIVNYSEKYEQIQVMTSEIKQMLIVAPFT